MTKAHKPSGSGADCAPIALAPSRPTCREAHCMRGGGWRKRRRLRSTGWAASGGPKPAAWVSDPHLVKSATEMRRLVHVRRTRHRRRRGLDNGRWGEGERARERRQDQKDGEGVNGEGGGRVGNVDGVPRGGGGVGWCSRCTRSGHCRGSGCESRVPSVAPRASRGARGGATGRSRDGQLKAYGMTPGTPRATSSRRKASMRH